MRGKLEKAITDKIYVTEGNRRREATEKLDMEQVCMKENMERFTQTQETPQILLPLLKDLGITAEGPAMKDVLEGTYVPSMECDTYAIKLLQHLEMPQATIESNPVADFIEVEDHIKGWKQQKENTGSDVNGLTFSHYIAACEDKEIA